MAMIHLEKNTHLACFFSTFETCTIHALQKDLQQLILICIQVTR